MSSFARKGLYKPNHSPYFHMRVTHKGQRICCSTGTADEQQAAEFYDRKKAELWEQDRLGLAPEYRWEDAVNLWARKKQHLRTYTDSIQRLRWLDQFLGGVKLNDINDDLIDLIREAKKTEPNRCHRRRHCPVSDSTVNRYTDLVRTILRLALQRKWITALPVFERAPEPKRVRWLTDHEVEQLFRQLPPQLVELVRFALATGLRASNIQSLRWDQIDLVRREIYFAADEMKNKQPFVCPLNADAVTAIRRQLGKHPIYVFTTRAGDPIRKINTGTWRRALERAGIADFRFHDLRHTWATWHLRAGTPLHALQRLGGWSSLDMVMRYAHLVQDELAAAAERIAANGSKLPQRDIAEFKPWRKSQ